MNIEGRFGIARLGLKGEAQNDAEYLDSGVRHLFGGGA